MGAPADEEAAVLKVETASSTVVTADTGSDDDSTSSIELKSSSCETAAEKSPNIPEALKDENSILNCGTEEDVDETTSSSSSSAAEGESAKAGLKKV